MKRLAGVVLIVVAMVAFAPAPAAAEDRFGAALTGLRWDGDCCAWGVSFDYARPIHVREVGGQPRTSMSIFGEFNWNRWNGGENDSFIYGGVREHFMLDTKFNPYVHAMAGFIRWTIPNGPSGTDFSFGFGGGVEYQLTGNYSLKAQYDLMFERDTGGFDNLSRFSFGGVYRFGGARR